MRADGKYVARGSVGFCLLAVYWVALICDMSGFRILAEGTWSRSIARNIGGVGLFLIGAGSIGMATHLVREGFSELFANGRTSGNEGFKITPDGLGRLFSFLVPRKTRAECFEPFFEDLKADRLEKIARKPSRRVKRWIEFCFYFRLCVTVVQSLGCYLTDALSKVAPFIRALFFRGGS